LRQSIGKNTIDGHPLKSTHTDTRRVNARRQEVTRKVNKKTKRVRVGGKTNAEREEREREREREREKEKEKERERERERNAP